MLSMVYQISKEPPIGDSLCQPYSILKEVFKDKHFSEQDALQLLMSALNLSVMRSSRIFDRLIDEGNVVRVKQSVTR